jgi:hypothetical protein
MACGIPHVGRIPTDTRETKSPGTISDTEAFAQIVRRKTSLNENRRRKVIIYFSDVFVMGLFY